MEYLVTLMNKSERWGEYKQWGEYMQQGLIRQEHVNTFKKYFLAGRKSK